VAAANPARAMPEKQPAPYDPRPKMRGIVDALRLPAGPDPRFATPAAIAAHLDDFTAAVHGTWKDIQAEAIREIVQLEILLSKADPARMPKGMADWLRYLCRSWRRVIDAVAWGMLGRREMIHQLCQHRVRPTLIESNPKSVAMVLDDINKDPLSMAIWNDATTFLDVGDITARRSGTKELDFIELKQGKVNLAILELQQAMSRHRRAGEPEKAHAAIDAFHKAHGASGFRQLMRVTKQLMGDYKRTDDVNDSLANTADRDRDIDIQATISDAVAESYDPELTQVLRRADADGATLGCIDGCLWIYVFLGEKVTRQEAIAEFSRRVFEASPETRTWLVEKIGKEILSPVGSVDQWAFIPTGFPIFLRLLEADDIVELLHGKLTAACCCSSTGYGSKRSCGAPDAVSRGCGRNRLTVRISTRLLVGRRRGSAIAAGTGCAWGKCLCLSFSQPACDRRVSRRNARRCWSGRQRVARPKTSRGIRRALAF
jgi:hypothetical protein